MKKLAVYFLLLIPTFILISYLWYFLIEGRLYYCTDPAPIIGFIPPLVHSHITGDFWIASPSVVYFLWFLCVVGICIIPYILVQRFFTKRNFKWIVLGSVPCTIILLLLFPFALFSPVVPYDLLREKLLTEDKAIQLIKNKNPELGDYSINTLDTATPKSIISTPELAGWYFEFVEEASGSSILKGKCFYVSKDKSYIEDKDHAVCASVQNHAKTN